MAKLEIEPQHVLPDVIGNKTRSYWVSLPEGVSADDLKDPAIWSRCQGTSRHALQKHDKLYLVGFAEAFAVEARVIGADTKSATLSIGKIIKIAERMTPLFSDENYRVVFAQGGYRVERIADGAGMGPIHQTEAAATRHLHGLYPQRVA